MCIAVSASFLFLSSPGLRNIVLNQCSNADSNFAMSQSFHFCSLFLILLIPTILSLPSTKPGLTTIKTSSIPIWNSSLLNSTRLWDDQPILCLEKPRMHHIDTDICRAVTNKLLARPDAQKMKDYQDSTTDFGESPCHIVLKRSFGHDVMQLTVKEIVLTVNTILGYCNKYQGAGWAQFHPTVPWYILVYGDPRVRTLPFPLEMPN